MKKCLLFLPLLSSLCGCASTEKLHLIREPILQQRVAFDFSCDEDQVRLTPLGPLSKCIGGGAGAKVYKQYGAECSGQKAVYVDNSYQAYSGQHGGAGGTSCLEPSWVLNSDSRPAENIGNAETEELK